MRKLILTLMVLATLSVQAQQKFFMIMGAAGGGSGTLERTWKVKPVNQFLGTTQFSGWSALPGSGDNSIVAGTTWLLRDITNSNTSSISFVATDGFTTSGGSVGTNGTGTTNGGIFCLDQLTMHGWLTTASTVSFKITGLTAGKYYDIGIFGNSENFKGLTQSVAFSSGGSIGSYSTGNNYGACGPSADDLDDPAIKWVTNQQPTSGEITITLTRTNGTGTAEIVFSGLFIQQYSGSH
jgi:hypothetical protein